MQNKNLLQKLMLFGLAALISNVVMAQLPRVTITSDITTNTTWTNNNIYVLSGYIYVTNRATLTIQAGTVIYGDDPNLFSKGALIVTRGAKINAVGTPCRPIVFTSGNGINKRKRGDWGGVILLGKANINPPGDTAHIEGISPNSKTLFGGGSTPNDNDNSGTMQYVRIEFAGVALSPNNEINGLTLGGVGRGTTLDHIQVSYSNDDSYEWFGGTANAKYLVAYRGIDDDFDTDNGFSGNVQFGISLRDPKVADVSKSHGFESDNDASGDSLLPQTKARFSNMTIDAGKDTTSNSLYEAGTYIRRNSALTVENSIIMGWPVGVYILSQGSEDHAEVKNNVVGVYNSANNIVLSPANDDLMDDLMQANRFRKGNGAIKLTRPYSLTDPDFRPKTGSPALSYADFSDLPASFFTPTTYSGALSPNASEDWTNEGWVNWTPTNTDYSNGSFGTGSNCPDNVAESKTAPAPVSPVVADVQVSPNPNKGAFNVSTKGFATSSVNVRIADLHSGKIYYTGKATNNSTTKLSVNIPAGNYAVELSDGKNVVSQKVSILY